MKQNKARHHFLAVHYLRRFTAPDGLLWLYPLDGSAPRRVHPRNAAVERYLYASEVGERPHDDILEEVLAETVDGPAAPALERLINGDRMLPEHRAAVALYIALQELRVPAFRDQHSANVEQMFRVVTNILAEHPDHVGEKAAEYGLPSLQVLAGLRAIKDGRLRLAATKVSWLDSLFKVARDTAPLIAQLLWIVVEAPPGFEFVTSDCPVVKVPTDRSISPLYAGGWVSPSAEGTLVLDPGHVLVMKAMKAKGDTGRRKGALAWCNNVNSRTVAQAYRYVFSRSQQDCVAQAIQHGARGRS